MKARHQNKLRGGRWPCARGEHRTCSGGLVAIQAPELTSGKIKAGSRRQLRDFPLRREFLCSCECHK